MKFPRVVAAIVFAMLSGSASFLRAQSPDCSSEDSAAIVQPTDAVYEDAIELARTLSEHHFALQCILTSKLGSLFQGMKGAALYRTADGDIGVLFLPKSRTFVELSVVERSSKKGFVYSFTGKPRALPATRLESERRQYFLKKENQLLIVGDEALRLKLQNALNLPVE